jgi:hypothetical protein
LPRDEVYSDLKINTGVFSRICTERRIFSF